ncbi:MAG: RNA-binding protein [Pseudomonadota bacterium]
MANTAETTLADEAAEAGLNAPVRTCLATRTRLPKERLIRFVVAPDGTLTPDLDGKLPGRGLYVRPDREALEKARKKRLFARAARQEVFVADDLVEALEALITRRALDSLAMARRAGAVITGFEKVRSRLKNPPTPLVLAARDGAADGRTKISRLADAVGAVVASPFDRTDMARVLGREDAVHATIETSAGFASLLRYIDWLDAMRNEAENRHAAVEGSKSTTK